MSGRGLVRLRVAVVLAAGACTPGGPGADDRAAPGVTASSSARPREDGCGALLERYEREREALNRCRSAEDCLEEYPGLCPRGPHYVDRAADRASFDALLREIDSRCVLPRCEAPMPLGPAACRAGRCVSAR